MKNHFFLKSKFNFMISGKVKISRSRSVFNGDGILKQLISLFSPSISKELRS